ncbi:MAG: ubiquinol-cytochrome C chaperone family protein [Hyphomicrobiales bacterium]
MLNRLFSRRKYQSIAGSLYAAIMAQARQAHFYARWSVPDTLDGRFEMLVVHAFLVIRRIKGCDETGRKVEQALFDHMFSDLDQAIREAGVSDVAVPRKIKAMASAFYGRAAHYEEALAEADAQALVRVIARNVFPDAGGSGNAGALGAYMRRTIDVLESQPDRALIAGRVEFCAPEDEATEK